jgi:mycofactocin precursor
MSPGKVEHTVGRYAADMENDQTLVTSASSIGAGSTSVELVELDEFDEFVADELLIEEISIDGMCGVY